MLYLRRSINVYCNKKGLERCDHTVPWRTGIKQVDNTALSLSHGNTRLLVVVCVLDTPFINMYEGHSYLTLSL